MLSCLGSEMNIKGYIFKPFYLLLGVLCFILLLSLLATFYIVLYIKNTLVNAIYDTKKHRDKHIKNYFKWF